MSNYADSHNLPPFLVTAVGAMPHKNAEEAVELILQSLPTVPHIPQLSKLDPREQMWLQYTEGLPRFTVDFEQLTYKFNVSGDTSGDLERFYAAYLQINEGQSAEHFEITGEYGAGIHLFLDRIKQGAPKPPFIKVQVTGPLSFALTITDEEGKAIFYHPEFRDVAVKGMGLKAVWLVDLFKPYTDKVIVFFDEPSLSAYGTSAYLGVSKDDVIESLNDVISMVSDRGGISGVHCCGNTDWGLLAETATRIINFDAVDYMESMAIYKEQLEKFLGRGGVLAWGAVPNDQRVEEESCETVIVRIKKGLDLLEGTGIDRNLLKQRMIVTPACGCSGLTIEQTQKAYAILSELDAKGESKIQ